MSSSLSSLPPDLLSPTSHDGDSEITSKKKDSHHHKQDGNKRQKLKDHHHKHKHKEKKEKKKHKVCGMWQELQSAPTKL